MSRFCRLSQSYGIASITVVWVPKLLQGALSSEMDNCIRMYCIQEGRDVELKPYTSDCDDAAQSVWFGFNRNLERSDGNKNLQVAPILQNKAVLGGIIL